MKQSYKAKSKAWVTAFLVSFFAFTGATTEILAQNYCSSEGSSTIFSFIDVVNFDGINNVSGNDGGYADFTNLTANVTPGNTYSIDLTSGSFIHLNRKKRWRVWIDYNSDGDFNDSGELVFVKKAKTNASGSITIPSGVSGSTRMRISMNVFSNPTSCAHFSFGEVEDYTVSFGPVICDADAGTLTAVTDTVCAAGGSVMISAIADGNAVVPTGYINAYALTSGSGLIIEQTNTTPDFTVSGGGLYTIHSLVFDPNTLDLGIIVPGVTTGFDVNSLLIQGGGFICASLDVAGAPIQVENPDAGTLTSDATSACLVNGSAVISATPDGNIHVPNGYTSIFVLTSGSNLVIEQVNSSPSFTVNNLGLFTIHTLVYNPSTLDLGIVAFDTTTGADVLGLIVPGGGAICASLDVAGAPINVVDVSAGGMIAVEDSVCAAGGSVMISATPDGNAMVPAGFINAYALTSGAGLVIEQTNTTPDFTVEGGGLYTIHSLVFDPNTLDLGIITPGVTTGFDVNNLLIQGGGTICASLDVPGAPIYIDNPDAGTLTADFASICLVNGNATLTANPDGNIHVPAGYSTIYVLTEGSGLVIKQVNTTAPEFSVSSNGMYTLHTLVYDPNTLDLGIVAFDTTTGVDVFGLIVPGGGSICASLDVAGAPIEVTDPNAGTMTADADTVCGGGSVSISATPDGNASVPPGYLNLYVLTSGAGLVIEQTNTAPTFTVDQEGLYTIHSLVADPNTLDLGIITPGVTTGVDVLGLITQGGGSICASLDVAGAPIYVENPTAGTLTPDNFISCVGSNGSSLTATPNNDAFVPGGYSTLFVLTRGPGLVIEQVNATPTFTVTNTGLYRIHTLVYNPQTLDLSIVVPGTTTGFDVNGLLVQGGGSICASLDVAGAPFIVFPSFICDFFGIGNQRLSAGNGDAYKNPQQTYDDIMARYEDQQQVLVNVYPNPADGQFNVDISGISAEQIDLRVFNVIGQTVYQTTENVTDQVNLQVDASSFEAGVYFVQIQTDKKSFVSKLEVR